MQGNRIFFHYRCLVLKFHFYIFLLRFLIVLPYYIKFLILSICSNKPNDDIGVLNELFLTILSCGKKSGFLLCFFKKLFFLSPVIAPISSASFLPSFLLTIMSLSPSKNCFPQLFIKSPPAKSYLILSPILSIFCIILSLSINKRYRETFFKGGVNIVSYV